MEMKSCGLTGPDWTRTTLGGIEWKDAEIAFILPQTVAGNGATSYGLFTQRRLEKVPKDLGGKKINSCNCGFHQRVHLCLKERSSPSPTGPPPAQRGGVNGD